MQKISIYLYYFFNNITHTIRSLLEMSEIIPWLIFRLVTREKSRLVQIIIVFALSVAILNSAIISRIVIQKSIFSGITPDIIPDMLFASQDMLNQSILGKVAQEYVKVKLESYYDSYNMENYPNITFALQIHVLQEDILNIYPEEKQIVF